NQQLGNALGPEHTGKADLAEPEQVRVKAGKHDQADDQHGHHNDGGQKCAATFRPDRPTWRWGWAGCHSLPHYSTDVLASSGATNIPWPKFRLMHNRYSQVGSLDPSWPEPILETASYASLSVLTLMTW